MTVEPSATTRPSLRLRADIPDREPTWPWLSLRPLVFLLGGLFLLFGGAGLDLGEAESRLGMALGEAIGPYGRVFGYWDPSLWPVSVFFGRIWAFFEEEGPSQGAVRWPAAIAGVWIALILARRARLQFGPRAGVMVALAWCGSLAMIDRSSGAGLDLIAGLGTIAALDRLLARGSGWVVGAWASLAFLAAGWPPLAVLALATVVLGRSGSTWSWSMTLPVAATVVAWSAWALSLAPAEAWATALAMPITQGSAWNLAIMAIGLGLPWIPFAWLAQSPSIREGWGVDGRKLTNGWLQVAGAALIVGTIVPGLASAALMPALAGLAMVSGCCWDRIWAEADKLTDQVRRRAIGITLVVAGLWLAVVLAWAVPVGFAVAYYRTTLIVVGLVTLAGTIMAVRSAHKGNVRWSLGAIIAVSVALKLGHWGYFVPELNYRTGAGPWGRAIGQWVPETHPIYVLHSWPADLCFATGRPVRQLPTPGHLDFQPGPGSKFVLLLESEYAEYLSWGNGWPKLVKVREFEDESGTGKRVLARTDAPLIVKRPYRKHDPVVE